MDVRSFVAALVLGGAPALAGCEGDAAQDAACPGPLDAGVPAPVTIRLRNERAANVYLGQSTPGCATGTLFSLEDAAGHTLNHSPAPCERTCAELMRSSCACQASCAAPTVTLLAPGGHVDLPWAGWTHVDATMPADCYADSSCAGSACLVPIIPSPPLTVRATARSAASGCAGACVDCTPDASGSCIVPGATVVGGASIEGEAPLQPGVVGDAGSIAAEIAFE